MVHVRREAGHDVGGGVVREHGLPGGIEDVEDVIHGLEHVAVADAHALVGRLDRELVPAARVALLEEVQAFEAGVEGWVRFGLLAAVYRDAVARCRATGCGRRSTPGYPPPSASASSSWPGNSASVTSPSPDGVKPPVWADVVPPDDTLEAKPGRPPAPSPPGRQGPRRRGRPRRAGLRDVSTCASRSPPCAEGPVSPLAWNTAGDRSMARCSREAPRPLPPFARESMCRDRAACNLDHAGSTRCSASSPSRFAFAVRSAAFVTISRRANRSGRNPSAVETSYQRGHDRGSRPKSTWMPTSSPRSTSATRVDPKVDRTDPGGPGQSSRVQTRRILRVGSPSSRLPTTVDCYQPDTKKPAGRPVSRSGYGRGGGIRTHDHQSPRLVRYQTAPRPDEPGV